MKQCECILTEYRPFILGGDVHHKAQCGNKATIIVFPKVEADGDPMYVCDRCYKEFEKLNPDYEIKRIGDD
jgi:CTP:molybdopterin cytidylyltransferase MocA